MMRPHTPDSDNFGKSPGALIARAARYGLCLLVGYFGGAIIGTNFDGDAPSFWPVALVGALVLLLVFRRGVVSQNHAANDVILAVRNELRLAQQHVQTVQVGTGNVAGMALDQGADPSAIRSVDAYQIERKLVGQIDRAGSRFDQYQILWSNGSASFEEVPAIERAGS